MMVGYFFAFGGVKRIIALVIEFFDQDWSY